MKIQDVIDEVNTTWGEEHEEKKKKIFRENIFKKPMSAFCGISIMYLSPLLLVFPFLVIYPDRSSNLPVGLVEFIFNIPYYLFDLRSGVIASIASLLLSLYVSVGKYADTVDGIRGEARRAAYRQFAELVAYVIFTIFIINFWHGLFSGFLSRTVGWGKNIVPDDVNIERYADIPLWILIFFAWFTLASCLMLVYSEKDILIKNASVLSRAKNVTESKEILFASEYSIARYLYGKTKVKPFVAEEVGVGGLGGVSKVNEAVQSEYGTIFYLNRGSIGFGIKTDAWSCVANIEFLRLVVLWLILALFSTALPVREGILFFILASVLFSACFFVYMQCNINLFSEIYKFNVLGSKKGVYRIFKYLEFYWQRIFNFVLVWISVSLLMVRLLTIFLSEVSGFIEGFNISFEASVNLLIALFFVISVVVSVLIAWLLESVARSVIEARVNKHSLEAISGISAEDFGIECNESGVNYIIVAYIYCSMENISKIYSEYKLGIDE